MELNKLEVELNIEVRKAGLTAEGGVFRSVVTRTRNFSFATFERSASDDYSRVAK